MHFEKDKTYHIYNRSNNTVFYNDRNYLFFLSKVKTLIAPMADILAWCLMPNHFHMLISPGDSGLNISKFVGGFKSKTTRIGWRYEVGEKMWQGRFHDHVVRPDEALNDICEYILNNPVRKNLTKSWEDYRFCGSLDPIPA